jgi:hypothetical protein
MRDLIKEEVEAQLRGMREEAKARRRNVIGGAFALVLAVAVIVAPLAGLSQPVTPTLSGASNPVSGTTGTFSGDVTVKGLTVGADNLVVNGITTFNSTAVLPSGQAFAPGSHAAIYGSTPGISGFGTSPSIVSSAGTAAFQVNVGTGGVATSGTITFPAVATGWVCICQDVTTNTLTQKMTANSNNSCTITSSAAYTASDKLWCVAVGN